ncbi:MAG: flagellar hook-basal body protein [Fibrobacteria bacterium]|nr:flagellar hook-basal body protein [Fibrobacteria bacterium]
MVNGLYSAGMGMMLQVRKQELTANNIANVQTTGFKLARLTTHDTVESRRDVDQYMRSREDQRVDEVTTDWRQGPMIHTSNPLDVALRGDGFLVARTDKGDRYFRSASLQLNADRELVDLSGSPILDAGGNPVRIPGAKASIDADGKILSDGVEVGSLARVDFPRPYALQHEGGGKYRTFETRPGEGLPKPVDVSDSTSVETGFLEGSNTNQVETMVQMIAQFRNYEADARVAQAVDSTLDKAVNQVGRVG